LAAGVERATALTVQSLEPLAPNRRCLLAPPPGREPSSSGTAASFPSLSISRRRHFASSMSTHERRLDIIEECPLASWPNVPFTDERDTIELGAVAWSTLAISPAIYRNSELRACEYVAIIIPILLTLASRPLRCIAQTRKILRRSNARWQGAAAVGNEGRQSAVLDADFARVGAQVPTAVALSGLNPLPEKVTSILPEMSDVMFTRAAEKIVLINPRTRVVIGVIER
jgi:hypothetical protein